jgi:hypothetical protein
MRRLLVLLMSALLLGCETVPPPPDPTAQPGQAAIGIAVAIRPPLPLGSYAAAQIYFARVGDDGEPALEVLYASGYFKDGRAYALNVPPGRYAAVAGAFKVMGTQYISYFPRAVVTASTVPAAEGRVAFAGRYGLDSTIGVCPDKADALQLRIAEVVSPGVPKCGLLRMALHETFKSGFVVVGGMAFPAGPGTVHYGGRAARGAARRRGGARVRRRGPGRAGRPRLASGHAALAPGRNRRDAP